MNKIAAYLAATVLPGANLLVASALLAIAVLTLVLVLMRRRNAITISARRDEKAPFDSLLSASGEMLCLHDGDGVILKAAGAVTDLAGVPAHDIVGLRLDDFVHMDDRLAVLALWTRFSAGEVAPLLEFRLVQPDGRTLWVEARFTAVHGAGGTTRFGSALRDVTRRHSAESELRGVRDDLSSGIAAGQGSLYRLVRQSNGKWKAIFFAANIERITGYSVAEAMKNGWPDDLLSLPNRASRWSALNGAIESGNGTAEYDLPTRDGAVIRVRDHFRRWDRSDASIEIVGYLVDITEAYGADLRVRQAQEEIAAIASVGPGVLYRTIVRSQDDQQVVFVSQNVANLSGLKAEDVIGPGWLKNNLPSELRALQWKNMQQAIQWGSSSTEYHYTNGSGRSTWARDTVRHVQGQDGRHEIVGYWVNITEEKERTLQLAQASKLATLGEMATGMAHELSQPLASISMAAETAGLALQASPADLDVARQRVERILQQTERAAKLIDHLRIFGRKPGEDKHPVDLTTALDGALMIVDGRLRKAKARVTRNIEPDLPMVTGASVLVEQVMLNLIANACDAYSGAAAPVEDEKRSIDIAGFSKDGMVYFVVADHAGGIKVDDISKVFQPFYTSKAAGEGTGLGLSISYSIISEMGGTITADNSDDGAVFEIRLPVSPPDEIQDVSAGQAGAATGPRAVQKRAVTGTRKTSR